MRDAGSRPFGTGVCLPPPPQETRYGLTCVISNSIALGQAVLGAGRGTKNLGEVGAPPPWDGSVADTLETRSCPTGITAPNLVTLGGDRVRRESGVPERAR